jgi:hypothetical protein
MTNRQLSLWIPATEGALWVVAMWEGCHYFTLSQAAIAFYLMPQVSLAILLTNWSDNCLVFQHQTGSSTSNVVLQ